MKIQSPKKTKKIHDAAAKSYVGTKVLSRPTKMQNTLDCLKKSVEIGGVVFKEN